MIGIPEELVPNFIRKNRIIITFIVIFLLIVSYVLLRKINEGTRSDSSLSDFRYKLTKMLLDSSAKGLNQYYKVHGKYPQCNDKYFFDSIKTYINVPIAYIYADSIKANGQIGKTIKTIDEKIVHKLSHTYLGIGTSDQFITYRLLTPSKYKLYSIGENLIDENGKGDDELYSQ